MAEIAKKRMDAVREEQAKKLFKYSEILQRINEISSIGYGQYVWLQPSAVDYHKTSHLQGIKNKLQGQGFRVEWVETTIAKPELQNKLEPVENPTGGHVKVKHFKVTWDKG